MSPRTRFDTRKRTRSAFLPLCRIPAEAKAGSYRIDRELHARWLEEDEEGVSKGQRVRTLLEEVARLNRPSTDIPEDLRGLELRGAKLRGIDLSRRELSGADLSQADLRDANFLGAKLVGAILYEADLERAELTAADLRGANLEGAKALHVGFGGALLNDVSFFNADLKGSVLTEAHLEGADLRCVILREARFRRCFLTGADLTGADLRDADFEGARVERSIFHDADLRGARVSDMHGYEKANWIGVDLRGINFTGGYLFRRHVLDVNFLAEFRARSFVSAAIYWIWWLTSDCGRSIVRWGAWTFMLAVLYAITYTFVEVDYGAHQTAISPLYFSIVTMTTLGFGDAVPASLGGQIITMTEVVLGYVMLGGLLSIFANKMARRAD